MTLVQVFVVVHMLFCASLQYAVPAGPYDIIINRFTNCAPQDEGMMNFEAHTNFVRRDGKKVQLFGADMSLPFNNEEFNALRLYNEFYQRKTNDYLLMYKYEENMCTSLMTYCPEVYKSTRENMGIDTKECAVPPGNYTLQDYIFDFDLPAPMLEYGGYKVITRLFLETKLVCCIEAFGDVEPKE